MHARRIIPAILLSAILLLVASSLRAQSDTLTRRSPDTLKTRSSSDTITFSDLPRPRRERRFGVVAGYHGFGYHYFEAGLAYFGTRGDEENQSGVGVSGELRLGGDRVIGAVASAWSGGRDGPLSLGLSLGYYGDSKGATTLRLRPELVLVLNFGVRIGYGYSIVLAGSGFNGINRHDFSFRMMLPF